MTEGEAIAAEAILLEPLETPVDGLPIATNGGDQGELDLSLAAAERRHIEAVFERMGHNKRRTARALGISRTTLDRKLGD